MRQPLELTGGQLRAAFEANSNSPGDLPTIEEAIGLSRDDCAVVLKALDFLAGRLDQVERVHVYDPDDPEGDGIYFEGLDFLVEWAEKPKKTGRKQKVPELVKVVRKGERQAEAPTDPKPRWPSSPPKRDLPTGRGLFSSAGKRESPKPGVVPVPLGLPGAQPLASVGEARAEATPNDQASAAGALRGEQEGLPPIQDLAPTESIQEARSSTQSTQSTQSTDFRKNPAGLEGQHRPGGGDRQAFQRKPKPGGRPFGDRPPFKGKPGERRRFQGKPRPGGDFRKDRPGSGERPFGDRPPFKGKPGERPRFQGKPRPGSEFPRDRPGFGERRPFGDRPPYKGKPGERPRFQGNPRPGGDVRDDRPGFDERRPFGDRPTFKGKPGERPRFQGNPRPGGDFRKDRPGFGEQRRDEPRPFGDRPPFKGKPGERPRFQGKPRPGGDFRKDRPGFGERRPFGDRPPNKGKPGERPRFQGTPPGGDFRKDRAGFGEQRRPLGDQRLEGERRGPPAWKRRSDLPRFEGKSHPPAGRPFKKFPKRFSSGPGRGPGRFGKGGPKGGRR